MYANQLLPLHGRDFKAKKVSSNLSKLMLSASFSQHIYTRQSRADAWACAEKSTLPHGSNLINKSAYLWRIRRIVCVVSWRSIIQQFRAYTYFACVSPVSHFYLGVSISVTHQHWRVLELALTCSLIHNQCWSEIEIDQCEYSCCAKSLLIDSQVEERVEGHCGNQTGFYFVV